MWHFVTSSLQYTLLAFERVANFPCLDNTIFNSYTIDSNREQSNHAASMFPHGERRIHPLTFTWLFRNSCSLLILSKNEWIKISQLCSPKIHKIHPNRSASPETPKKRGQAQLFSFGLRHTLKQTNERKRSLIKTERNKNKGLIQYLS